MVLLHSPRLLFYILNFFHHFFSLSLSSLCVWMFVCGSRLFQKCVKFINAIYLPCLNCNTFSIFFLRSLSSSFNSLTQGFLNMKKKLSNERMVRSFSCIHFDGDGFFFRYFELRVVFCFAMKMFVKDDQVI